VCLEADGQVDVRLECVGVGVVGDGAAAEGFDVREVNLRPDGSIRVVEVLAGGPRRRFQPRINGNAGQLFIGASGPPSCGQLWPALPLIFCQRPIRFHWPPTIFAGRAAGLIRSAHSP
jgi:hypothetical protein